MNGEIFHPLLPFTLTWWQPLMQKSDVDEEPNSLNHYVQDTYTWSVIICK
jgi:hypothetical protein